MRNGRTGILDMMCSPKWHRSLPLPAHGNRAPKLAETGAGFEEDSNWNEGLLLPCLRYRPLLGCGGFASSVFITIDLSAAHAVSHIVPGTSSAEATGPHVFQVRRVSLAPALCGALSVKMQSRHEALLFERIPRPANSRGGKPLAQAALMFPALVRPRRSF